METVIKSGEAIFFGKLVAAFLHLLREIPALWEEKELDWVVNGVVVVELVTEFFSVLLPVAFDEDETTHLHALTCKFEHGCK